MNWHAYLSGHCSYLMFAAIFITVKSVQKQLQDHEFTVAELFSNKLFATLIVSMTATYLLYLVMSFLFLDPWHMFTSVSGRHPCLPPWTFDSSVHSFCNISC